MDNRIEASRILKDASTRASRGMLRSQPVLFLALLSVMLVSGAWLVHYDLPADATYDRMPGHVLDRSAEPGQIERLAIEVFASRFVIKTNYPDVAQDNGRRYKRLYRSLK